MGRKREGRKKGGFNDWRNFSKSVLSFRPSSMRRGIIFRQLASSSVRAKVAIRGIRILVVWSNLESHVIPGQSLLSTKIKVLSPLPNMMVEEVANLMLSPHLVRAEPNFNVPDVSHTTLYL